MKRSHPLSVEQLEPRLAPATFGDPWADPGHLTISFVPAGTQVGPLQAVAPSSSAGLPADWQQQVLRAFETWAAVAPLNFSVVPDNGAPLGTAGAVQGDPRFGDIRVALVPLGTNSSLATSYPFEPAIGTWSGDVLINSTQLFGENGGPGYDLYSVALHEAGHVLGFPDTTTDPASVLYSYYELHTGLAPEDVQAVQALYGPAPTDSVGNSLRSATDFQQLAIKQYADQLQNPGQSPDPTSLLPLTVTADLNSPQDADFFHYQGGYGGFRVILQTDSLLEARLSVFDQQGHLIQSIAATDPEHGDLSLHLNSFTSGYYIEVSSADPNFAVGSYRLQVVPDGNAWLNAFNGLQNGNGNNQGQNQNQGHNQGQGQNQSFSMPHNVLAAATPLSLNSVNEAHFYGSLANPGEVDFYSVTAPKGSGPETMNVSVFAQQTNGLSPAVTVYDAHGNPVNATLVLQNSGSMVVQVPNAVPHARYYIGVQSNQTGATGAYLLGVNFSTLTTEEESFANGSIASSTSSSTTSTNTSNSTTNTPSNTTSTSTTASPLSTTTFSPSTATSTSSPLATNSVSTNTTNSPASFAANISASLPANIGLHATGEVGQILLAWSFDPNATTYNVYRSTSSGQEVILKTGIPFTTTSFVDSDVTPGVTYYYIVTGADGGGHEFEQSNEASNAAIASPPATPTSLTATAGDAQVSLSWSPVSGATSYNLYRSTTSGGEASPTPIATGLTTFTDTAVNNGTTYYYTVAAVNSAGQSPQSSEANATPQAPVTAPDAPTNLTATPGNAQVSLTWDPVSGATSYNLYRSTTPDGEANTTLIAAGPTTSFTDTDVSNGTTYYYTVTAVNSAGEGSQSAPASATPQAPPIAPSLVAIAGNGQVGLTWSAGPNGTTYNLYRSTSQGQEGTTPYKTGLTTTSFTDTGLANGTTYYYTVTAVNSAGESSQSAPASATPQAPVTIPVQPTGLTATGGGNQVALSWAAVPGAVTYNVYRSTTPGGEAGNLYQAGLTTTSFTDTSVTAGTAYYYTVTAVNTAGESPPSVEASATPTQTAPPEESFRVLTLNDATFFHFDFSVQSATQPGAAMAITVFGPTGNVVYSTFLKSGQSTSVDLFLAPGTYVLRFVGGTADGSALQPLSFQVNGMAWSDLIGPPLVDPNAPPPPPYQWTNPTTPAQWLQYGLYKFLTFLDAYNQHPLPLGDPPQTPN